MRINTRFSVAVHILTVTALVESSVNTSELLAKSVNTNPVVIRRIIAMLKKSGLVDVKPGIGGTTLRYAPEKISLLDIYNAVKTSGDAALFSVHKNPNPHCFVGANIHETLHAPLSEAQKALEEQLSAYTLKDIVSPIAEKRYGKQMPST